MQQTKITTGIRAATQIPRTPGTSGMGQMTLVAKALLQANVIFNSSPSPRFSSKTVFVKAANPPDQHTELLEYKVVPPTDAESAPLGHHAQPARCLHEVQLFIRRHGTSFSTSPQLRASLGTKETAATESARARQGELLAGQFRNKFTHEEQLRGPSDQRNRFCKIVACESLPAAEKIPPL